MKALLRVGAFSLLVGGAAIYAAAMGADGSERAADEVLRALLMSVLPVAALLATWDLERHGPAAWVRHGKNRRLAVGKTWGARLGVLAGCMCVLCVAGLIWTRTFSDPLLMRDILHTVPVALAGSLAMMALATAARLWIGKIGLLLVMGFAVIVGGSEAIASVVVPGGHVLHLLGTGEPLPFAQLFSMLALYLMAGLFTLLSFARIPR